MGKYENLIKRLRDSEHEIDCSLCDRDCCYQNGKVHGKCIIIEAADAIEALSKKEKTTHWIPVTERLPEKTGKYLVCCQWRGEPAETWVCELIAFGKIKGWANEARNPAVTHWMPLPEPPKEEAT